MTDDETSYDRLAKQAVAFGNVLALSLAPGHAFALFLFECDGAQALAFLSNAERVSLMHTIEAWLALQMRHPLAVELQNVRAELARVQHALELAQKGHVQ